MDFGMIAPAIIFMPIPCGRTAPPLRGTSFVILSEPKVSRKISVPTHAVGNIL